MMKLLVIILLILIPLLYGLAVDYLLDWWLRRRRQHRLQLRQKQTESHDDWVI